METKSLVTLGIGCIPSCRVGAEIYKILLNLQGDAMPKFDKIIL